MLLFLLGSSIAVAAGMGLTGVLLNKIYSSMPMTPHRRRAHLVDHQQLHPDRDPLLHPVRRDPAALRHRPSACMPRWCSGCRWLPGGLMHSNIGACALFGSVSGSSVATAATIGVVAMGEIDKHKYNEPLFLGTLAAGGTLGILIPPSINMIIYGVMTDTSVPKLYLAGFLPGFILTVLFSLTVLVACIWKPHWGGNKIATNWEMRIAASPRPAAAAGAAADRDRRDLLRRRHRDRSRRGRHRRRARHHRLARAAVAGACCATSARARCAPPRWWWRSWSAPSSSMSSSRRSGSPSSSAS